MNKKIKIGSMMMVTIPTTFVVSCSFFHAKKNLNPLQNAAAIDINDGPKIKINFSDPNNKDINALIDNTPNDQNFWNNFYGTMFDQDKILQTKSFTPQELKDIFVNPNNLDSEKETQIVKTINKEAKEAVDKIVEARNKETQWNWHTIGDPTIDAINNVRYAIYKTAMGDNKIRGFLKTFVKNTFNKKFTKDPAEINAMLFGKTKILERRIFIEKSLDEINAWLNSNLNKDKNLFPDLEPGSPSGEKHLENGTLPQKYLEQKYMHPLKIDLNLMKGVEWRTQQIEWKGVFDDHHAWDTNVSIGKGDSSTFKNAIAPNFIESIKTKGDMIASENWVFPFEPSEKSDFRVKNKNSSETNIYDGMLSAVSTMYDDDDGEMSGGHRTNWYATKQNYIGYSINLINSKNANSKTYHMLPYLFTWTTSDNTKESMIDKNYIEKLKIDPKFQWIKTIYGEEVFEKSFIGHAHGDFETFLSYIFNLSVSPGELKSDTIKPSVDKIEEQMFEISQKGFISLQKKTKEKDGIIKAYNEKTQYSGVTLKNFFNIAAYNLMGFSYTQSTKKIYIFQDISTETIKSPSIGPSTTSLYREVGVGVLDVGSKKQVDVNGGKTLVIASSVDEYDIKSINKDFMKLFI